MAGEKKFTQADLERILEHGKRTGREEILSQLRELLGIKECHCGG